MNSSAPISENRMILETISIFCRSIFDVVLPMIKSLAESEINDPEDIQIIEFLGCFLANLTVEPLKDHTISEISPPLKQCVSSRFHPGGVLVGYVI